MALAAPSSLVEVSPAHGHKDCQSLQPTTRVVSRANAVSDIGHAQNWAGVILTSRNRGTFKSVTGTLIVPNISGPDGSSGAAWVGIDGSTYWFALVQTGIDFTITGGNAVYRAWYEFYPDKPHYFDITINPGDVINATIVVTSPTSATATIQRNGQPYVQNVGYWYSLNQVNAEWIVENYKKNNCYPPFADFGSVTFTNAIAKDGSGNEYNPRSSDASVVNIRRNGTYLTSVSTGPQGTITIKRVT